MKLKYLNILLLTAGFLLAQTAKYPTSIATDEDLLVAKDRSASTLTANISNSTLTVPVASGSAFVAYESITIDSEQMVICSIDSNTLTLCTGSRGFNGTGAVAHNSGAAVRGHITSWHHNALREEIQAIETAWGVNKAHPVAFGTNPPGACTVADLFYDTDAGAGLNLFGCTATNVWTLLGDGGGGTSVTIASEFTAEHKLVKSAAGSGRATEQTNVEIDDSNNVITPGGFQSTSASSFLATGKDQAADPAAPGDAGYTAGYFKSGRWKTIANGQAAVAYPTISGSPSEGNCVEWGASGAIADAGAACGAAASDAVPWFINKRWTYAVPKGAAGGAYTEAGTQITTAGTQAGGVVNATDSAYSSSTTNATTDSDGGYYTSNVFWPGTNERLQVRGRHLQTAAMRFWAGFFRSTPFGNDTGIFSSVAAFRFSTAVPDTNYQCVTCDGAGSGNCTVTDSGVAADTASHKYEVYHSGANYIFKLDGNQVCSHNTNLPSTNDMGAGLIVRTLENGAKEIRWYGLYAEADK